MCGLVQPATEHPLTLYRRRGVSSGLPRRRREAWVLHNPWTALGWSQPETVQGAGTVLKITGDDYRGRRLISWIGEVPR